MASKNSKTDKKAGKDAGKSGSGSLEEAIATFRVDSPSLNPLIDEAAFGSGDYPHKNKMSTEDFEKQMEPLQIELSKAQNWVTREGRRFVVVFEGRDAAGKGGAIKWVTENLNPRTARVVALSKPTPVEQGQWYFQRYTAHMPTKGELVLFDRSWYNRAGVEPVMGFCTPEETTQFLKEAPKFEAMLARDGIVFVKLFLTIGREMQLKRLHERHVDPLKKWKLSPIDYQSLDKWSDYSEAFERMLPATDSSEAPWRVIKANDKKRARLAVIREVLAVMDYPGKDKTLVDDQDRKIALSVKEFLRKGGEPG